MKKNRFNRCYNFRKRISKINVNRLSVYKSKKYIYCQIFSVEKKCILCSCSSLDLDLKNYIYINYGVNKNKFICSFIGKCIADKAISLGYQKIIFDKSGYRYHGCIKNLADSARKNGLKF